MSEENYLIEKITNADDNLKKNCLRYSKILCIGNAFSIGALVMFCYTDDIISNVAFLFVACSSIISSIITVKLTDMYNEMRQLNSKIIIKLNDENKQEVI